MSHNVVKGAAGVTVLVEVADGGLTEEDGGGGCVRRVICHASVTFEPEVIYLYTIPSLAYEQQSRKCLHSRISPFV
jgi:hypothetical protein